MENEIRKEEEKKQEVTMDGTTLREKAVLAKLVMGNYTGGKRDKFAEEIITQTTKAKGATVWKHLLHSPELSACNTSVVNLRNIHNRMTSPWGGNGLRILNMKLFSQHMKVMQEGKENHAKLVRILGEKYEELLLQEPEKQGDLYNSEDYLTREEVENRFYIHIHYSEIPANDFRTGLQKEDRDRIIKIAKEDEQNNLRALIRDPYMKLYEVVEQLFDILKDPKARLYDVRITSIARIVEVLPYLNITNDPQLSELIETAKENLASLDPDDLRKVKEYRKVTSDLCEAMLQEMNEVL